MTRKVIEVVKFDPSKLTNFLNAQDEAKRMVDDLNREHRGTGKVHSVMRMKKDELSVVQFDYAPLGGYGGKR